ncbi:phage minor tail protein L, partial [Providencia rettgeri]|nr:phage minor tail protein L [Providencia rettgeri]
MIYEDVQKLAPGNLVTMYEIDCRAIGGDVERYHNHNDGVVTWQGQQ